MKTEDTEKPWNVESNLPWGWDEDEERRKKDYEYSVGIGRAISILGVDTNA